MSNPLTPAQQIAKRDELLIDACENPDGLSRRKRDAIANAISELKKFDIEYPSAVRYSNEQCAGDDYDDEIGDFEYRNL